MSSPVKLIELEHAHEFAKSQAGRLVRAISPLEVLGKVELS